ncbi:MAG TPA: enoyl-CoA hydratase family protein [Solirubrobacteraceae bacterium]|nr:enoyl-CoA hydratase family protein [Solirubrobacteraceae bacterium]
MTDGLRIDVEERVATLTFERPAKKNPLTFAIYAALRDWFRGVAADRDVRAIVLTGAGGNFCSGGDVEEIIGPLIGRPLPELLEFTRMTAAVVGAMRHCPQPVIAAVDGVCAGAGAALAMAADIRLATPRARTAFLFTRVGLAGADMGACAILPRIIGHGRAAELLLTGRSMDAQEAERCGFYSRLVDPGELAVEARALALSLASGPTLAHATTTARRGHEWAIGVEQALDAEAQAQAICMQTRDFERAYRAFAARERPVFGGD